MILMIARKEFRSLIVTPSTWLILGGLQFIFAWFFLARLDAFLQVQAQLAQLANAPGATLAVATPLFDTLALIFMMLVPVFTMRLIAEERRNQTLVLLMAAPISGLHIILGKFLGIMLFFITIIISCTFMTLSLSTGTQMDIGLLLCNAFGLLLLVSSYTALGLYLSSLTSQPVVAALTALASLFGLWLTDISAVDIDNILHTFSPTHHFQSFNMGLINCSDLVYFCLFIVIFLFMTIRRMNHN